MTLDELIAALEAEDPERVLPLGFSHPHSYRGDYTDLAFEPTANATVGQMLAEPRDAVAPEPEDAAPPLSLTELFADPRVIADRRGARARR